MPDRSLINQRVAAFALAYFSFSNQTMNAMKTLASSTINSLLFPKDFNCYCSTSPKEI